VRGNKKKSRPGRETRGREHSLFVKGGGVWYNDRIMRIIFSKHAEDKEDIRFIITFYPGRITQYGNSQ